MDKFQLKHIKGSWYSDGYKTAFDASEIIAIEGPVYGNPRKHFNPTNCHFSLIPRHDTQIIEIDTGIKDDHINDATIFEPIKQHLIDIFDKHKPLNL